MESIVLALTLLAVLYYLYLERIESREDRTEMMEYYKDLMDRQMSRDFAEYKEYTQAPVKFDPVEVSEETEYYRELEAKEKW